MVYIERKAPVTPVVVGVGSGPTRPRMKVNNVAICTAMQNSKAESRKGRVDSWMATRIRCGVVRRAGDQPKRAAM